VNDAIDPREKDGCLGPQQPMCVGQHP
jgi:hypothetical protein